MSILLAFAPFLTFAFLQSHLGTTHALWAAAAVSALLIVKETVIGKKSLKPLETVSLVMFAGLAFASKQPWFSLSVVGVRLVIDSGLFAMVLLMLAAGQPFTFSYAREKVPTAVATTQRFLAMNISLSTLWLLAFAVIVAADAAMLYWPGFTTVDGTIAIVAAIAIAGLAGMIAPKLFASKAAA